MRYASTSVRSCLFLCLLAVTGCYVPTLKRPDNVKLVYAQPERKISMKATYHINGQPGTKKIRFLLLLPSDWPLRQRVTDTRFSLAPTQILEKDGRRYAEYVIDQPGKISIHVESDLVLLDYDLMTAKGLAKAHLNPPPGPLPDFLAAKYLKDEYQLNIKHPLVLELANEVERRHGELERIRRLFKVAMKRLSYGGYSDQAKGAVKTLESGVGDCTDYSDVMVAALRVSGIPARHVRGYTTFKTEDTNKHSWIEIYTRSYGWIPFDLLFADQKTATYDDLPLVYISLTDLRSDPVLKDKFQYWFVEHWGEPVTVSDHFAFTEAK